MSSLRYCEHFDDDYETGKTHKCKAPALYMTCEGLGCRKHKCRCAKPLPAEERVEVLEREVVSLRARVNKLRKKRRGYLHQLECEYQGRAQERKGILSVGEWGDRWVKRAKEAEKIANLAMTEGLKAAGHAPPDNVFKRVCNFIRRLWSRG